jgi:hypothetical protein
MLHDPPLIIVVVVVFGILVLARVIIDAASVSRRPRDHAQPPGPPPLKLPPRGGPF